MGFWEFITNATPPTAIVVMGGLITINKGFWEALGIMLFGSIIYFTALWILFIIRKHEIRWS